MAIAFRRTTTCRQTPAGSAAVGPHPRAVRARASQQPPAAPSAAPFAAAALAALLLAGAPAGIAAPVNPVAELGLDPVGKVLQKLDNKSPPKGVPGPEVPGQFRADPVKAKELAKDNTPGGSTPTPGAIGNPQ